MTALVDTATTTWLAKHTLLRVLPGRLLRDLRQELREQRYARGQTIYSELEHPHHFWVVKEGCVRLVRYSSSGRAFALRVVTSGGCFCIPSIMSACLYPCRAIADTHTTVLILPAQMFRALLERYPALACEALKLVCQQCCQAHAVLSATQERVEQRVLSCLVQLQESFGTTLPFSREELADLVGTSRETANRILKKFEHTGAIRLAFRQLTVRDPARLRSWMDRSSEKSPAKSHEAALYGTK